MTHIKHLIFLECDKTTNYNELFMVYTDSDKLPKFYILVDTNLNFYKDKNLKNNINRDFLKSNGIILTEIAMKFIEWYKKNDSEKLKEIRKIKLNMLD